MAGMMPAQAGQVNRFIYIIRYFCVHLKDKGPFGPLTYLLLLQLMNINVLVTQVNGHTTDRLATVGLVRTDKYHPIRSTFLFDSPYMLVTGFMIVRHKDPVSHFSYEINRHNPVRHTEVP
jgi:hypothetical protein